MPRLTDVSPGWVPSPRVQGMLRGGGLTGVIDRFTPVDVPQSESDALIWLFNHSGGLSWTNNTNWLTDTTVGNWFGVTVVGGHVTRLDLSTNNCVGNISAWAVDSLASLTYLLLYTNSLSGDLSGWSLPTNLIYLYLYSNSFSGDLSSWTLSAQLASLRIYSNSFSGVPDISGNTAMRNYQYQDNALSQADVDAVLLSIYNRRMAFTWATPILDIGGTNAAPSGVYGAACPPGTGKEYAFELVNDSCGDGFNKWVVTFTP